MVRQSQIQGWNKNKWHEILERETETIGIHIHSGKYESLYSQVSLEIIKPQVKKTVIVE